MKASSIIIGNLYEAKAGRNVTVVKIKAVNETTGGWICETAKGKRMNIADAARFVKDVTPREEKTSTLKDQRENAGPRQAPDAAHGRPRNRATLNPDCLEEAGRIPPVAARDPKHLGPKPKGQMSALSAAHRVLQEAGKPMGVREILETALAKKYCDIGGKTPFNTINGGIRKEIKHKGDQSRFERVGPGLFAAR